MDSSLENVKKLDKTLKKIHIFCGEMGKALVEGDRERKAREGELGGVREELRVAKRAVGELERLLGETQELVVETMVMPQKSYSGEGEEEEGEDVSSGVAEDESVTEEEEEEGEEEGGERKELEKVVRQRLNGVLCAYFSPLSRKVKLRENISPLALQELLRLFEERERELSSSSSLSPEIVKEVCDILFAHNDLQIS